MRCAQALNAAQDEMYYVDNVELGNVRNETTLPQHSCFENFQHAADVMLRKLTACACADHHGW